MPRSRMNLVAPAAKRQILELTPREVSLVDFPANLQEFVILKNQGDPAAPAVPPAAPVAPVGLAAIQAALTDLAGRVTGSGKLVALDDLKKALEEAARAEAVPTAPPAAPPAAQPGQAGFDAKTFAAEITKSVADGVKAQLIADGVIEAPRTPIELVVAKFEAFEGEVAKSFKAVTDAMSMIVADVQAGRPAPPASGQAGTQPASQAPGRQPSITNLDVAKSLGAPIAPPVAPAAAQAAADPVTAALMSAFMAGHQQQPGHN